jgi:pyruvate-ferredoxin/flavodoxin oxidoreductase
MQMAFFHLTRILPGDSALAELQAAIAKSYSSKAGAGGTQLAGAGPGPESLAEVPLQPVNASSPNRPPVVPTPRRISSKRSPPRCWPASAMRCRSPPCRRTAPPMGTTRWEKRNIAEEIPIWKEALCTQ